MTAQCKPFIAELISERKDIIILNNEYNRREITDNVFFTSVTDKKFKINKITVCFISPLSEDASVNAVIPRLLTKCNEKLDTMAEFNRRLAELYSASINWTVLADTDYQICELSAVVLADKFALNGEKISEEIVGILLDCIFSPYFENGFFPQGSLNIEKQNQTDDNDAEINDKTSYSYLRAFEEAFKGEPAEIHWGGTNDQVNRITAASALEAYRKMITSARTEIICVGESSFDGISDIFAKAFRLSGRCPSVLPKVILSPTKDEVRRVTETLDIEQSKLVMFFKSSGRYKGKYALIMVQLLYGGTESSKLFTIVREKMSLCYYCFSRCSSVKGYLTAECGVDAENLEKAEKEALNQLKEIADGNFTDDEISKAKLFITNALLSSRDTVNGISSKCLSQILYPDESFPIGTEIEKYNAVTREDIILAAKAFRLDTVFILRPGSEEKAE